MLSLLFRLSCAFVCIVFVQTSAIAADTRMQVDVVAETEGVEVSWLHANVREASALALPQLWNRIVPQYALGMIPKKVKAVRFMQKASPTEAGVRITFHQPRVLNYLKEHKLPYIAEQPALNVVIQLYNKDGRPMGETTNALLELASSEAAAMGYRIDDQGASLVLLWRWLDDKQVSLSVRGNSKLSEYAETRMLTAADPLEQLKSWMSVVLLKARDAHVEATVVETEGFELAPDQSNPLNDLVMQPLPKPDVELRLAIQRHASLADQVLFEQDLRQDPRILALSLRQVNRDGQQYRLQLKGSDDQWLTHWFARRGMTLVPTIEGWVVQ